MSDLTFENFDKFDRKKFANRLTTVIEKFSPFYDEAFVLSLNAKFGSGKTTFLKMWKEDLEKNSKQVVYINAWETDFDNEPILPIVSGLLSKLTESGAKEEVKSAFRTVLGTTALIANTAFDQAFGLNPKELLEAVEKDQIAENVEKAGELIFSEYSYKKMAFAKLRENLSKYVADMEERPLIIFVDELDRVRPDYAVKFLEAIKHLFSVKGVCFVLAVDREQIESSIRQLYGNIDFDNYYRRFITREANLPDIFDLNLNIQPFISFLTQEFLDEKRSNGLYYPFDKSGQEYVLSYIVSLCKGYRMRPREIESYFRIFSQFMVVFNQNNKRKIVHNSWAQAACALIAIFIRDRQLYHRIGRGAAQPKEILEHLDTLVYSRSYTSGLGRNYHVQIVYGAYLENGSSRSAEIADICFNDVNTQSVIYPVTEDQRSAMLTELIKPYDNFGRIPEVSCFSFCYRRLEEWAEFIE